MEIKLKSITCDIIFDEVPVGSLFIPIHINKLYLKIKPVVCNIYYEAVNLKIGDWVSFRPSTECHIISGEFILKSEIYVDSTLNKYTFNKLSYGDIFKTQNPIPFIKLYDIHNLSDKYNAVELFAPHRAVFIQDDENVSIKNYIFVENDK